jgi:ribonuclease VapC
MILDSSAIVAILCREPGHMTLIEKMLASGVVAVGAPTVFETAMVLTIKMKRDGLALVHDFLQESGVAVAPFTQEHASCAFAAYLRFGKGRHRAPLNFGDCLSYAAAKVSGQPLLFVGDAFAGTDVLAA